MAGEDSGWREEVEGVYREAMGELLSHVGVSPDDMVEFFKDELREALLDLKQAVIQGRAADAVVSAEEARVCMFELKHRRLGGE